MHRVLTAPGLAPNVGLVSGSQETSPLVTAERATPGRCRPVEPDPGNAGEGIRGLPFFRVPSTRVSRQSGIGLRRLAPMQDDV